MNLFKMLGNLGNIAKMQQEIQALTAELASRQFEGKAGGGLVRVVVSGSQQLLSVSIDPKLVEDNDRELIEGLIVSAVNEAMTEAKTQSAEFMQKQLAEKFDLPDMQGLLDNFMPRA